MAPVLAKAYCCLIERHCLGLLCGSRDPSNPPIGGLTKSRTDEHFAQAFGGSAARSQLALLDPIQDASAISNAFMEILSGGRVCFVDAPCGAGAAVFACLSTIAELRANDILPRYPLEIHIIGAEISKYARDYALELLNEILSSLQQQAIFITFEFVNWDVTRKMSNTDLIRRMIHASPGKTKKLLVVANFNGFLEKERKRKDAEAQIEELFRHAAGENSIAIWIEPDMNLATGSGGLFSWLEKQIKKAWYLFARLNGSSQSPIFSSASRFYLPTNQKEIANVRLSVMRLDLERSE